MTENGGMDYTEMMFWLSTTRPKTSFYVDDKEKGTTTLYTPKFGADGTVIRLTFTGEGGHYENGTIVKKG